MSTSKSAGQGQSAAAESTDTDDQVASIDAAIQGALGRKLRESYDEVVKEAVPDKFMQLLDQLKKSEKTGER
jgi:hypothetical protein